MCVCVHPCRFLYVCGDQNAKPTSKLSDLSREFGSVINIENVGSGFRKLYVWIKFCIKELIRYSRAASLMVRLVGVKVQLRWLRGSGMHFGNDVSPRM